MPGIDCDQIVRIALRQKRTSLNMEEGGYKSADELDLEIEKLNEEISVYRNALSKYLNSRLLFILVILFCR